MSENDYKPFSARHGYEQPKAMQRESIDDDLRNGLWNVFYECFPHEKSGYLGYLHPMHRTIWTRFLKKPADDYRDRLLYDTDEHVVKEIFQSSDWYRVFDIIEFIIADLSDDLSQSAQADFDARIKFINQCNQQFEKENSAYKIVGKYVIEIISKQEIESIETAMITPYRKVNDQIEKALTLLSNRKNPDYYNSIKESISAVETLMGEITDNKGFSKTVDKLHQHGINLHGAHKQALKNLYGFACDADGIRHGASSKNPPLDINRNTALFMLVTCSAFVNYIIAEKPTNPSNCD